MLQICTLRLPDSVPADIRSALLTGTGQIAVCNQSQDEAVGERNSTLIHDLIPYDFLTGVRKVPDSAITLWQNRLSLPSLSYVSRCKPQDLCLRIISCALSL